MVYTTGKSRLLAITFLLLCEVWLGAAFAQTVYVGDTLRVGIRPEPVNGGPSIAVVSSGAALEILERQGRYTKVRSASGVEGWVKSAYLSREKPAQILLKEARAHSSRLEREIAAIKNGSAGQSGADGIDVTQMEQEKQQLQLEVERLQELVDDQGLDGGHAIVSMLESNQAPIYFLIGGLIFILSLGFLFGVTWHKHQVTKRLGGLSL